jgi:hypothetical protein
MGTLRMSYRAVAVALLVVVSTGCISLHHSHTVRISSARTVVGANCLTAPIILQGCDFAQEPPKCRLVTVSYRQSCAEIQVRQTK